MSTFNNTLSFLYGLQLFGIKVGLHNIQALLKYNGHPEQKFPSVHIAGTNGKGSTAAMIASVLTASGYKTGLYTSPHLRHFSERIKIDGVKISEEEIVHYTKIFKRKIQQTISTFFEATTAIAFAHFADQHVDVAVIETGLGGRLDATNVIIPELSVITNIGLDHTEYLGSSYASIAREKGGIIKRGIPCITGIKIQPALDVLRKIAAGKKSHLIDWNSLPPFETSEESLNGFQLHVNTGSASYRNLYVSMAGIHQASNASLAITAIDILKSQKGFNRISENSLLDGMSHIRKYSGLRGRIDVLSTSPLIVADVGHNADGIRTLAAAMKRLVVGKCVVMFGVMNDKEYRAMVQHLVPLTRCAIVVQPETPRARESSSIVAEFHKHSCKAVCAETVRKGMEIAFSEQRRGEVFLIAGSHYLVGEAMENLRISA